MEEIFRSQAINFTLIACGILFVLVLLSIILKERTEFANGLLYWSIASVIVANTVFLAGSTISLNLNSITGGPVHWHSDFEIWNCGQKLDLVNPKGLSNRVGTPVLHEHNDGRIHVEGVVVDYSDISLGTFFNVVGGSLTNSSLQVPTTQGVVNIMNGQSCNGEEGQLQIFVYKQSLPSGDGKTLNNVFSQGKIGNPSTYVMSGKSAVPPGDCIIIEFDSPKGKTDKICEQYKLKMRLKELNQL